MPQTYILVNSRGKWAAESWIRSGVNNHNSKNWVDAERDYKEALGQEPDHAGASNNLAVLYAQTNRLSDGLLEIERASLLNRDLLCVWLNYSMMCMEARRLDDAVKLARYGYDLEQCKESRATLYEAMAKAGIQRDAAWLLEEVIKDDPSNEPAHVNSCFIQTLNDCTQEQLLAHRLRWYGQFKSHCERKPHHVNYDWPLRVGYVGGDFKYHSSAAIFSSVIEGHSKNFEPYLYANNKLNTKVDIRSKKFSEHKNFRDISSLSDEQADELIRKDKIDILVDLAGHTFESRLRLFTRKPAPVQVTAWGFAVGTGVPEIDYFFTDDICTPVEDIPFFVESVVHLPCIMTFSKPLYDLPESSPLPYFENSHITYGSFCRYDKVTDQYIEAIHRILQGDTESRILFKDYAYERPEAMRRMRTAMPDIKPHRLMFLGSSQHQDHLQAIQKCDMMLDPFPHSGGVGSMEQLYMGVPIVTLYGKQISGRLTASLLTRLNLKDWIAKDVDEYVQIAKCHAANHPYLKGLRKHLRMDLMESPVVSGYVTAVEDAYVEMYNTYKKRAAASVQCLKVS